MLQALRLRGLVADVTNAALLEARLAAKPLALYCGFDPTAPSLHVGNLLAMVTLLRFQEQGHRPIALIGGATGLIGDPSGRSTERPQQDEQVVVHNAVKIQQQLESIFGRRLPVGAHVPPVAFVNNADFYKSTNILDFVGRVGRHIRVSSMLGKDSVKTRLASEAGISYAEFSYQLFQAYDFYALHRQEQCILQIGGSDQWGNITAGIDLIHKLTASNENNKAPDAFGLTLPLITDATGQKFGKSAGNAVWLSPELTRPFAFYQFFVRTDDQQVGSLLRYFTFLPLDEIDDVMKRHGEAAQHRLAQKTLARHVTELVHGPEAASEAEGAANALFASGSAAVSADDWIRSLVKSSSVPSVSLARNQVVDCPFVDVAVLVGLCSSKSETRRLIASSGLYFNNATAAIKDPHQTIAAEDLLLGGTAIVLRSGKKNYRLVNLV